MIATSAEQLTRRKCAPCEGGVPPLSRDQAEALAALVPGWKLSPDVQRIRRHWVAKNFLAAMEFFNKVTDLAEQEGHHPDLHLEGYRNVTVELWTHAIDGLSENDFIMAAKIDQVPIALKH